ncbi:MAG: N-acetyltransferase family protein [Spirochaetaceae bacterium]
MANSNDSVEIRVFEPRDAPEVKKIVRKVFSLFTRASFHVTPNTLVAVDSGRVVGAVVLKFLESGQRGRTGIVSWIFVDPDDTRRGVAAMLRDAALDVFSKNECAHVLARIDRDNTSATNLFAAAGFEPTGPGTVLSIFGFQSIRILRHTAHIFDPGHALFIRSGTAPTPVATQPWLQLVASLVLHIPIVMLLLLRILESPEWSPVMTYRLSAVVAALILIRLSAMWLVARYRGIRVQYHIWESGFLLSLGVAGIFGFLMPVTGSLYPREPFWSVREFKGPLASMAAAGLILPAVILLVAVWATSVVSDPHALAWLWWIRRAGAWFLLTDGLLPVEPFSAYNAARIYRWSRTAWVCTAGLSLAVSVVAMTW